MSQTWSEFGNNIIKMAKAKRSPLVAQLELTSRCNLSCKMCYICSKSNDKEIINKEHTSEEWIDFARKLSNAGVLYVLLTGGEVFIRKDFKEIYEEISKMGFSTQIYTNATLITPEKAKWLGRIPPSKVSVTMYGASRETYKKICGDSSAYDKTVRGIDLLLSENIIVNLRTTIVRENCHDAEKIYDFAESRGMEFGSIHYVSPRREGLGTDPAGERLSPLEIMEYEKRLKSYLLSKKRIKNKMKQNELKSLMSKDIDEIVENKNISTDFKNSFNCSAGHCSFWVTWDGKMTPCGMMSEPYVDVFNKDFLDSWEQLKNLSDKVPACSECTKCEYLEKCLVCPAKLKTETGQYDKCSSYLYDIANLYKKTI